MAVMFDAKLAEMSQDYDRVIRQMKQEAQRATPISSSPWPPSPVPTTFT
jgi:hypothetical protein